MSIFQLFFCCWENHYIEPFWPYEPPQVLCMVGKLWISLFRRSRTKIHTFHPVVAISSGCRNLHTFVAIFCRNLRTFSADFWNWKAEYADFIAFRMYAHQCTAVWVSTCWSKNIKQGFSGAHLRQSRLATVYNTFGIKWGVITIETAQRVLQEKASRQG